MSRATRLIWLPDAVKGLDRLYQFLRANDPAAATLAMQRIREAVGILRDHPEVGRPYFPMPEFRELSIPFGSRGYVLRYRVTAEAVVVVRVWHSLEHRP
jgi:plasmid stabilization system protein ParE